VAKAIDANSDQLHKIVRGQSGVSPAMALRLATTFKAGTSQALREMPKASHGLSAGLRGLIPFRRRYRLLAGFSRRSAFEM
jgi:hypothetical protein